MKYYTIVNVSDNYCDMGFKCKTLVEAKRSLKELKEFDKRHGICDEDYVIQKIEY